LLSAKQYEFAAVRLNEIGKLLGGWYKKREECKSKIFTKFCLCIFKKCRGITLTKTVLPSSVAAIGTMGRTPVRSR